MPPATGAPALFTFHIPTVRNAVPFAPVFALTRTWNDHVPDPKLTPPEASTVHPLQVEGIEGVGVTGPTGIELM